MTKKYKYLNWKEKLKLMGIIMIKQYLLGLLAMFVFGLPILVIAVAISVATGNLPVGYYVAHIGLP